MLGPLQVTRSGEILRLGGHQQRAVLALLLAESGAVVSVGRLADELWGERTPGGFVTTLQTYVFHLREVLEPHRLHGVPGRVLVTEPGGYRLDTNGSTVDAALFESALTSARHAVNRGAFAVASAELHQALDLWRGEVLADVADLGFVAPLSARLEEMRQTARALRIEAELAMGLHADALPEIDGLVAEHPLWEQLQAQRITALYRSGRQSDALAAYRELRKRLGEELGIEPSTRLQELHQAVLNQAAALDWQGPGTRETTVTSRAPDEGGKKGPDPPERPAPRPPTAEQTDEPPPPFLGRRQVRPATVAVVVLLAAALAIAIILPWVGQGPPSLPANSVGSINPDGTLGVSARVGQSPDGLAFGASSLWAANLTDGTVSRIDPSTRAVQTFTVGARPISLTVSGHDAWVANFGGDSVSRVNTVSNRVVGDPVRVGARPVEIVSGKLGVWVANSGDGTIQPIDPATGQAGRPIEVGGGPDCIAMDDTSVWVCDYLDGTVSELYSVRRSDGTRVLRLGRSVTVGGGPGAIALTPTDVWAASRLSQTVTRINRATLKTVRIPVGDGPHSLLVADRAVWVSNEYDGTVAQIDPISDKVANLSHVGASPRGMTVDATGRVWVASGAFADPVHSGGTLRAVGTSIPGAQGLVDPAAVTDPATISAERFAYDGLVALGMSGGSASQLAVPDLAMGPLPDKGTRTYAFTLRKGIAYSTGVEVRATDFRTALLKALTVGGNPQFFAGIVGGRSCIDHPATCNLSSGLITDNAARRVTFNLEKPDPMFLYKLSRFLYPVPPGTSVGLSHLPVPGTGPYRIAAYVPDRTFTLRRNQHFRQWSYAAQPAGYPEVIDFHKVANGAAAADEVAAGRADVAWVYPASAPLRAYLRNRYPDGDTTAPQLKEQVLAQSDFEYLNARMAPFDDIRVRRALNYAVDRNRLVAIKGAGAGFSLTCQVLPSSFPSYGWYCPYTTGSTDGYHGPDLARARELVSLSGTRGMTVTLQGLVGGADHELNAYFASVLRELGYRVRLRELEPGVLPQDLGVAGSRSRVQITSGPGWEAEYPAASSLFDDVFSCTTARVGAGWYCDPQVERIAAEAHAAELSDPGRAARLWTVVYHLITDNAPVVALGNPTQSLLVSARVGNYESNPDVGPLLSQIWVR